MSVNMRTVVAALKTKIGDKISALVLDRVGTFDPLQRLLGVFVATRCGLFVIGLGGGGILRPAAAFLRERTHPLQRAGVILHGRLLEQDARTGIVLGPAGPLG